MRISVVVRHLSILLALLSPALLHGQFQQPTDEELKMTADPKAPGADVVYLSVEEIANDSIHYHEIFVRIKVLTEKGKEAATVVIPNERGPHQVRDIKGRTIHSDGTVITLTIRPGDLSIVKSGNPQVSHKAFTLPSVEVGSILEYHYQMVYNADLFSSPLWRIQRPYFVHKAHYLFTPAQQFQKHVYDWRRTSSNMKTVDGNLAQNLIWWPVLPPGEEVKTDYFGRFSVDMTDIPPYPDEEWMPPVDSFIYKVFFYYKGAYSGPEYWASESRRWSKEVDRFAAPSNSIKDVVAGLISPGDSDMDKAKKFYKAVQALDNTDYSPRKTESEPLQLKKAAKHADDIWAQKSGSREDIALLYLAMLRAAGLTAYGMKVIDRERGLFAPDYLYFDQFDDTVVILSINGGEIMLDPGEKMCPFQTVNWKHSGAAGFRQGPTGPYAARASLQSYPENEILRSGDVTIDDHGAINGNFRFDMAGQAALYWRQIAFTNDEAEVKVLFDKSLESIVPNGVEAHIDHFTGLDDPDAKLIAFVNAKGATGTANTNRLLLPAFFFETTRGAHPFIARETRSEPVDMHYGEQVTDQVTYHLPYGFSVEGVPADAQISWLNHALLVTKISSGPGNVAFFHQLSRDFTFAKPEEYNDLRAFYQKVAAADQQQIILTKSTSAPTPASPAP